MAKVYSFPWHTDACERQHERVDKDGNKRFFCKTHNQWASEVPVKVTTIWEYGDGAEERRVIEPKRN